MRPGGKLWISERTIRAVHVHACPLEESPFPLGFDGDLSSEDGVDHVGWVDVLVARISVLVVILVLLVAPVAFSCCFSGVTLNSLLCIDALEDTTFLHRVVGLRV